MRYCKYVLLTSLTVMIILNLVAQSTPTKNQTTKNQTTKNQTNNSSISKSMDSLKREFTNLKSVFAGKKKVGDTISISISGIDYDDANLSVLKENLKTIKGVKGISMKYKSGNASIEVNFNGKAADLWDALSSESKQFFKLQEAEDKYIVAEYKNTKKPS